MEMYIQLSKMEEVEKFVEEVKQYDFDIDMKYQNVFVDAKSILGVAMLMGKKVKVSFNELNEKLAERLSRYVVN